MMRMTVTMLKLASDKSGNAVSLVTISYLGLVGAQI